MQSESTTETDKTEHPPAEDVVLGVWMRLTPERVPDARDYHWLADCDAAAVRELAAMEARAA
jgi:hypothetical protein